MGTVEESKCTEMDKNAVLEGKHSHEKNVTSRILLLKVLIWHTDIEENFAVTNDQLELLWANCF